MPLINSVSDRNNRNLPSKNLIESNILRSYLLKIISKREKERERERRDGRFTNLQKKKNNNKIWNREGKIRKNYGDVWKIFDRNGERYGFDGGVSPSLGPTLVSINGGLIGDVG